MNINEKAAQVKTYIQEHKKQSIAVGLILLFLIGGSVALFAIPKSTGSAESGKDTSSMTVSDVNSGDTSSEEEASSSTESEELQEESTPAESTTVESTPEQTKPTDTKEQPKTETKKENTPATTPTTKPSTGGTTTNKPSTGGGTKPSHSHNWQPVTKQVNHPEQGHNEQVLVKEAWTESFPNYENKPISVCNGCGEKITGNEWQHAEQHALAGEKGGHHTDYIQVQVGVDTVNHPAQYTTKYVVDKPAWTETVTTGHKCSCGATK